MARGSPGQKLNQMATASKGAATRPRNIRAVRRQRNGRRIRPVQQVFIDANPPDAVRASPSRSLPCRRPVANNADSTNMQTGGQIAIPVGRNTPRGSRRPDAAGLLDHLKMTRRLPAAPGAAVHASGAADELLQAGRARD